MKKIISVILVSSFLSYGVCFAKTYAVEKPDGSLVIVNKIDGTKKPLEQVLIDSGLAGLSYWEVSEFPVSKVDRKYWKKDGTKIGIDLVKKKADEDAEATAEAKRLAILEKMKINKAEWDKIKKEK